MERSLGNSRCSQAALPLQANATARVKKLLSLIAEQQEEVKKRHLDDRTLRSSMGIAATETKLVNLSLVGRENSLPHPIHLRVQKQEGEDVRYPLDRSMPLRVLMAHYCALRGLPCGAVRFTYDGAQIPEAKSARDIGMDDGDVIYAWADVLGG